MIVHLLLPGLNHKSLEPLRLLFDRIAVILFHLRCRDPSSCHFLPSHQQPKQRQAREPRKISFCFLYFLYKNWSFYLMHHFGISIAKVLEMNSSCLSQTSTWCPTCTHASMYSLLCFHLCVSFSKVNCEVHLVVSEFRWQKWRMRQRQRNNNEYNAWLHLSYLILWKSYSLLSSPSLIHQLW